MVSTLAIRVFGDPVLRQPAEPIEEIDDGLRQLAEAMLETMNKTSSGVGLGAPKSAYGAAVRLRHRGGPAVVVKLNDRQDQWTYGEGWLSVPELHWPIVRAKQARPTGTDLSGNSLSIEADELLARVFQHEVDHLDGLLFIERPVPDRRGEAKKVLRALALDGALRPWVPGEEGRPATGPGPRP